MNIKLKQLKDIKSDNCITIIMNTHRTFPENQKDKITLKNLINEAENRLYSNDTKRNVKNIIENLRELEDDIDHNFNLESLILFVNDEIAEYIRLPIPVENRIVIDDNFATRDLVRAMHSNTNYYILVLSRQKTRLIEAFNDKVVQEINDEFPIENEQFFSTNKTEMSNASRQTKLIGEFFNRIDKAVNAKRKTNPLPVLICTEESNYHEYMKVADQKDTIIETFLNRNRLDEKSHAIVSEAWKIIDKLNKDKNLERKAELLKAVSTNKSLSDINDIYQAIKIGGIKTLFIERGLFQPAVIENNKIVFVNEEDKHQKEVIDDIYDELIEENMNYGGNVVFLPKGELKNFNGFGAITRY